MSIASEGDRVSQAVRSVAQALLPDVLATGSDMAEFLYRSVPAAEYETGVEDIALQTCNSSGLPSPDRPRLRG